MNRKALLCLLGVTLMIFCGTMAFAEEPETEWVGESAWAEGNPYNPGRGGNWAMYVPYADEVDEEDGLTVYLIAGRHMEAGWVHFSAPVEDDEVEDLWWVDITITLAEDFRFYDGYENVKIQDYSSAPRGNPAPGRFAWKDSADEESYSTSVPLNDFYGIHVEVEREVEVEPED